MAERTQRRCFGSSTGASRLPPPLPGLRAHRRPFPSGCGRISELLVERRRGIGKAGGALHQVFRGMQQGHFHPREAGEPRPFWEHPAMLAAFIVASALPLLWPDVSPLLDLPGHMGRYRVQLELANSPILQQYYGFHWALIGNLGIDVLVQWLAPLIGLEPAGKAHHRADPAAGGRRPALGRLRSPRPDPADDPVRPPLRLQFSLPVRVRELRPGDGARAHRLRLVAEARAPRQAAVPGGPVRAALRDPVGRARLRLGYPGRPRLLGRAGAPARSRSQFHLVRFPIRLPLPGADAPGRARSALAKRSFGAHRRLVQLGAQAGLAEDGAARPLGDFRHRLAGHRRSDPVLRPGRAGG